MFYIHPLVYVHIHYSNYVSIPQVIQKELLEGGLLHGDCLTVTGKTLAENLVTVPRIVDLKQVSTPPTQYN